jgi:GT2 family glycosyltransferase
MSLVCDGRIIMSRSSETVHAGGGTGSDLGSVTAVILTHMRPTLAGDLTRSLIEVEGLAADRIVVVVNGVGGLDDPVLESRVRMLRLPENLGPAGGFKAGMAEAFSDSATRWAYLCEDDIGLLPLPSPRLSDLMDRIHARGVDRVGAVVAFGRNFARRGAHTVNVVPPEGTPQDLAAADVGSWGATVVSRSVFDAGVVPDTDWFFGLEDFDYYRRVSAAGYEVLVDGVAARQVAAQQTSIGREEVLRHRRPVDVDEAWRAYYHARNSFEIARRHGNPGWHAWHLAYSTRKLQRARSGAERAAIAHGLWDGMRGRLGENPRYGRRVGEIDSGTESGGAPLPAK